MQYRATAAVSILLKFTGAVGDTIVGRVTQVQTNRWKVDVNSRLDAELRLANIQLPGGEQVPYYHKLLYDMSNSVIRFEDPQLYLRVWP